MRLNVEESAFSDPLLHKLAMQMVANNLASPETGHCAALGALCFLWHKSQIKHLIHVTREQVDLWLFPGAAELLIKFSYLKEEPEGLRVSGNQEQLAGLTGWLEQRRAAGKRSAERRAEANVGKRDATGRWAKIETPKEGGSELQTETERPFGEIQTTVEREPNETERLQSQFNSIQFNTIDQIQIHKKTMSLKTPTVTVARSVSADAETPPPLKTKAPKFSSSDLELAQDWIRWVQETDPHLKLNPQACAEAIRKAREHRNMEDHHIRNVWEWIKQDDFWAKNCLSPVSLLAKSKANGLKRIDNIMASIAKDKGYLMKIEAQKMEDEGIKPFF